MPKGYSLYLVALVGFVVAAIFVGYLLQPVPPHLVTDKGYQEQSPYYLAGGSACESANIKALPSSQRRLKFDACAEAMEEHRLGAGSLIEARRSAMATNAQAVSAYNQTGVATWGAVLGGLTLLAAIAAAMFAERAAFHAKSSVELYKSREKAKLVPAFDINGPMLDAYIENLGPTEAVIHLIDYAIFAQKPVGPIKFLFGGHGSANAVAVRGGGGRHSFGQFALPVGSPFVYFVGAVIYSGIFGEAVLMPCMMEIDRNTLRMRPLYDGDWSEWDKELVKFRKRPVV